MSYYKILIVLLALLLPTVSIAQDSDADGVDDTLDNCIEIANPAQHDSNDDGFGNACDADLDDSGLVNFADLAAFRAAFGTSDADADFDGDGFVDIADLTVFRTLFGKPPGPAGSSGSISKADAARFLTQTTFGPTFEDINHLVVLGSYEAWLDEQFELPVVLHLPQARELNAKMCHVLSLDGRESWNQAPRQDVWWDSVVNGGDQLRQRIAFALSEILVISDVVRPLHGFQFGMTNYYDILLRNAYGNYRELLEEVTLNPMMGEYLSHIKNQKADPANNIYPDENYAREILQLFSIGVHELNPDGTHKLDAQGNPIPSYGQREVKEFAKVFTGWMYEGVETTWQFGETTRPMVPWEERHDTGEKALLNGVVLPAGQDTRTDLEAALNNIFNHSNIGPFIGKQLIQRLVTSNPSPAYVQRVASVFDNSGQGVRGDLKAVVRAILLDPEARTRPADATHPGKLREPLLRFSHLWRAFGVSKNVSEGDCGQGPYELYTSWWSPFSTEALGVGQQALSAPSVFNFFLPSHAPQGPVSNAGLVSPEFQIFTETITVDTADRLNLQIHESEWATNNDRGNSVLILEDELAWAANPEQMLDKLNLILLNSEMSTELRGIIMDHLDAAPFPESVDENLRAKLEDAILLIINSPDYLIQK